ncbi:hypothetical protein ABTY00_36295 [Streptomyces microflavus]|uniref:hypothetical protein n=1 Tax=Streptomyces microflavus TaxID=1919 RepID=UPI00332278C1
MRLAPGEEDQDLVLTGRHDTLMSGTAELQSTRERQLEQVRETADGLRRRIDGVGGEKLMSLTGRIEELGRERERRRKRATKYGAWLALAGMGPLPDAASFHERTVQISTARSRAKEQGQQARGKLDDLAVARHDNTAATDALRGEITSLQQRSSIPAQLLDLR